MRLFEALWQDLRVAFRVLAKAPGATALAVLSLALGVGLTTAIFSLGDALLLRPIAVDRPGELLYLTSRGDDGQDFMYGWPDYLDMTAAGGNVASLAAYQRRGSMLAGDSGSEEVLTSPVTPNYFSLLGVKAMLGTASCAPADGQPRAVLGYRLWQRRFGGDVRLVGKTIRLGQAAFVVAGVLPEEFAGLERGVTNDVWVDTEAWFTVLGNREDRQSRNGQFEFIARLKPGVQPPHAASVLDAAIRGVGRHKPAPAGSQGTWIEAKFAPGWTRSLVFGGGLLAILSAVLFVACANAAQLRLAQVEARKKELGIRLSLGAGAGRVMRQLLVETAAVALSGAALGVLLAQSLTGKIAEFVAAGNPHLNLGIRLDTRVLTYALAALLFSVLFAGLAPARHAVKLDLSAILKSESAASGARRGRRQVLIAGQVAVSVLLFGMAVTFVASLRHAAAIRPGFDPQKRLLVLNVIPGSSLNRNLWCKQACERLANLPGARGATYARRLPLSGSGGGMTARVEVPGLAPMGVHLNNVGGNYFALMGTRVIAGRGIDANDREGSALVVVLSRTLARQLFDARTPLGNWVSVRGKMRQVVGVAEDGPSNSLHEAAEPFLYLPYAQSPSDDIALIVETAGEPAALERASRQELKLHDPRVMVYSSTTLRRHMEEALSFDNTMAAITTGLGVFGILLTGAGLFGLLQYSVSRRTRELGLRMALGARPAEIQRLVLGESLRMAAWGVPIGLALLGAAAWCAQSVVLGVTPLDPLIYAASAAAVLALTLLAAWLPARRATRVDPMAALRSE